MQKSKRGGLEIEIDGDSFIQELEKWNFAVAEHLAKIENVFPFGEDHWKVINYLRDSYLRSKIAPPITT